MASQPPRGKPPKRFRAAAAALRGDAPPPQPTASSVLDRDLGDAGGAAARSRVAPLAAGRRVHGDGGAVRQGRAPQRRFLRRTLADTAAHNARLRNAPFSAPPPRSPAAAAAAAAAPTRAGPRRVEVVLPDDRPRASSSSATRRQAGPWSWASRRAAAAVAAPAGMVLAKIAGVRCRPSTARSLELVRALEKLTLEFEAPKRRRSPSPSSSSSAPAAAQEEKKRRRRARDALPRVMESEVCA
ncbi:hypothetical protein JL721_12841 [Aureococcus anophagefferens]|nr:hypothetical protein JL721_12841 [Aureococcus anophagefferens]